MIIYKEYKKFLYMSKANTNFFQNKNYESSNAVAYPGGGVLGGLSTPLFQLILRKNCNKNTAAMIFVIKIKF